jgi:hypothetical protein
MASTTDDKRGKGPRRRTVLGAIAAAAALVRGAGTAEAAPADGDAEAPRPRRGTRKTKKTTWIGHY